MANIKNFGLVGVGTDVQFGKAGPRLISNGQVFKFRNADNSAGTVEAGQVNAGNLTVGALGSINMGGNKVSNVSNGTLATDGVNFSQLTDAVASAVATAGANTQALTDESNAIELSLGLNSDGTMAVFANGGAADGAATFKSAIEAVGFALAGEITARGVAETAERDARIAADIAGASAASDLLNTETLARLAGDAAGTTALSLAQVEIDEIESAVGLGTDGKYSAPSGTAYLGTALNLKDATIALDAAIQAVAAASGGDTSSLSDAIDAERAARIAADSLLTQTVEAYVNAAVDGNATADVAEAAARIAADAAIQGELNSVEVAVGLAADGTFAAPVDTNYINGATTVMNALHLVDAQVFLNTGAVAAETSARQAADAIFLTSLNTEIASRTDADTAQQSEIDTTQAGAGLEFDGTYLAGTGTNYLLSAISLKDADFKLDAAIKVISDALSAESSRAAIAEGVNSSAITAEVSRASAAEGVNAAAVVTEFDRAMAAELALAGRIDSADNAIAELVIASESGAGAVLAELDLVEAAIGLDVDGKFVTFASTNYMNSATSVVTSLTALDVALKAMDSAYKVADTTLHTALTAEISSSLDLAKAYTDSRETIIISIVDGHVVALTAEIATAKAEAIAAASDDATTKANAAQAAAIAYTDSKVSAGVANAARAIYATFDAAVNGGATVVGTISGFVHRIKVYITGTAVDAVQVGHIGAANELASTADVDSSVAGLYVVEVNQVYAAGTEIKVFTDGALVTGTVVVEYLA